jgi:hypothetical protein
MLTFGLGIQLGTGQGGSGDWRGQVFVEEKYGGSYTHRTEAGRWNIVNGYNWSGF